MESSSTDSSSSTDASSSSIGVVDSSDGSPSNPMQLDASGAVDAPVDVPDGGSCVVITPGYGCPGGGFVYMLHCGAEVQCCNYPSPVCP